MTIDPDNVKCPVFDKLFDDDQSFTLPAGTTVNGRPMSLPVRVVADETYRKMIERINLLEALTDDPDELPV
jgi:hypothetical protein